MYDTNNKIRKIYITDIKEGIILAAKRLGYSNIENKLKEIAEYEYGLKRVDKRNHGYIIPDRWFDSNVNSDEMDDFDNCIKSMTCEEAKKYVVEQFNTKGSSFRWDFVTHLVQKYKSEKVNELNECATSMYELLMQRKNAQFWESDGAYKGFKAIFQYLDSDKIEDILSKMISDYFSNEIRRDETKLFCINSDLDKFVYYYYQKLSVEDSINALKLILDMHTDWLTGNGTLQLKTYYAKNYQLDMPLNWSDFCSKISEKLTLLI